MRLFRKKKNEEIKKPSCACNGCKLNIKVLGAGCPSCHQQYVNVQEAVKNMGLNAEVEYITNLAKVMEYGVMSMPAIIVNEKVVVMGKVLKPADIEKLFTAINN